MASPGLCPSPDFIHFESGFYSGPDPNFIHFLVGSGPGLYQANLGSCSGQDFIHL